MLSANIDGTQRNTGKSVKHALYVLDMPKGTCRAEVTSNSENIKAMALAIIELHFSEDISQSVSQSEKVHYIKFFCCYFFKFVATY